MIRLAPELAWIDGGFEAGVVIEVGDDGRISAVDRGGVDRDGSVDGDIEVLDDTALLPGFVNAHSHAFQRGLRGLGETYSSDAEDFWSWRQAMYRLVGDLDGDRFQELCRQAFSEMLAAGITTVGEFHYLHHESANDHEFDRGLLAAAREAGIRLVLLLTYYRAGGIGAGGIDEPLEGAQKRFETPDPESFWRQVDELSEVIDPGTQSLGVAVHSIRAAEPGEAAEISREAKRRGLVCHMHLEEQPREIADCRARYGHGPLKLMLDHGAVGDHFTGVHLTHSSAGELAEFFAAGGNACICPLTEGNLGDGVPGLVPGWGGTEDPRLCLGSDSNARIDPFEEMRWLEYGQRLRSGRRGVLRVGEEPAPWLIDVGTAGGARALGAGLSGSGLSGIGAGAIEVGKWADFCGVDLTHRGLAGWTAETLAAMLVFGCGREVVAETWVGGRRL